MFRLIKLALYAFVGYALYELFQGMIAQSRRSGGGGGDGGANRGTSSARSAGSGQNLTGAGRGRTEETLDSDGGSVRHKVGRGVIST